MVAASSHLLLLIMMILLAALLVLSAHAKELRLHHRVYQPAHDELASYSLRGTLDSDSTVAISDEALLAFGGNVADDALYQVALEREGDSGPNDWIVSSVKACHFRAAASDSIVLHLSPTHEVYSLDYFVSPLPHDGSCPEPGSRLSLNTTVHTHHARLPPLPQLRVPPPLTPQGQVAQPEPEKSFLEKYWMYMVGGLLVMMLAPAPGEEGEKSGPAKN